MYYGIVVAMDNTFADLEDISMSELEHTKNQHANVLDGPFTVVHNSNVPVIGAFLHYENDKVIFAAGHGVAFIDPSYSTFVDKKGQTISFVNTENSSEYTIRALVEEDMELHYPDLTFQDLYEFKSYILKSISNRIRSASEDVTPYAVTVDGDEILGLFMRDGDEMSRRENGEWITLTDSDEDWADIEDYRWANVLSGAIEVFDENEDTDEPLILGDIDNFVVNQ